MIDYTLIRTATKSSLTFVFGDELYTVSEGHPEYEGISYALTTQQSGATPEAEKANGELLVRLYQTTPTESVGGAMSKLSEHITYDGSQIRYDDEPLHGTIVEHIIGSLILGNRNWEPLVNFLEKLHQNPSHIARRELFDWLNREGLTITDTGDFIGYKGLRQDGRSRMAGRAFVDGTLVEGHIPNTLGSVITMDRADVSDDRLVACGPGLHVGSMRFAEDFSRGQLATLLVSPADVVCIPADSDSHKMRVHSYRVAAVGLIEDHKYLGRNAHVTEASFSL